MSKPLSFQEIIIRFLRYWSDWGCIVWQPYYVQVGAGTMNPATALRVLGPEPWNVVYVEPSVRPADGRYAENPNRMQLHYQLQVILKPDPGNPQELYLDSLAAIGIDAREHDIRFVEDNWESPALGAWGLGWEVWLDGQEITQFTYFQQSGSQNLDPVAVELTYGLERITLALQGADSVWDVEWGHGFTYGQALERSEWEHCVYYFEKADVDALREVYDTYEREAKRALSYGLVMPAHDYVLKCSHLFNVLDTRGAVGVTQRAEYFGRMRDLSRQVAEAFVEQRQRMEYPILYTLAPEKRAEPVEAEPGEMPTEPAPYLLEIGTEELPATDLDGALEQLQELAPAMLEEARLDYKSLRVLGTPRRLVVHVRGLEPRQRAEERIVRGPPVQAAYDADGNPTKAAEGFARGQGVPVGSLERREMDGGEYVVAIVREEGRPTAEVLSEKLPKLVADLHFGKSMRWNETGISFSRPIRWLVSLYGGAIVPFEYADVKAGRTTRGTRLKGSPSFEARNAPDYFRKIKRRGVLVDPKERRQAIVEQINALAAEVGGEVPDDPELLAEVTHLVEQPTALRGSFEEEFLDLPREVLVSVMRKHQRYFAVAKDGKLLPYFIAVRNGDDKYLDNVIAGNQHVIRARFADARFFFGEDTSKPLDDFVSRIDTLAFQASLGSYLDKTRRLEQLAPQIGEMLGLDSAGRDVVTRAAQICKADLATQMVVEFTSLQGIMGRHYARLAGEPEAVAQAIEEHYRPRSQGDALPASVPGLALGLADRLDSMLGLFAVGMAPSGSADPYGLRRAALGTVLALLGHGARFRLWDALEKARKALPVEATDETLGEVVAFVRERLRGLLLEEGLRYDAVNAVLAIPERYFDPARAAQLARQLDAWVRRDDWQPILDAYARCVRIVRDDPKRYDLNPDRFVEPSESALYEAYQTALAARGDDPDVDTLLNAFVPMVPAITQFFDDVLVNIDDKVLRENRHALLQDIAALTEGVADLSTLEGF